MVFASISHCKWTVHQVCTRYLTTPSHSGRASRMISKRRAKQSNNHLRSSSIDASISLCRLLLIDIPVGLNAVIEDDILQDKTAHSLLLSKDNLLSATRASQLHERMESFETQHLHKPQFWKVNEMSYVIRHRPRFFVSSTVGFETTRRREWYSHRSTITERNALDIGDVTGWNTHTSLGRWIRSWPGNERKNGSSENISST